MTVNPERGELQIELAGKAYPLRPTYHAIQAIEGQLGAILALSYRHARFELTVKEMAVIATEAIRAAGEALDDAMLREVNAARVAELMPDAGLFEVAAVIEKLLVNMITGGAEQKKAEAAAKAASAKSESDTAG